MLHAHILSTVHLVVGFVVAIAGSYVWIQEDLKDDVLGQFLMSLLVCIAGFNLFFGLKGFFVDNQPKEAVSEHEPIKWYSKQGLWGIFLIYLGAVFYALAAFYHLTLPKWTFLRALMVVIPLILVEYHFSIRGNRMVHNVLQWNTTQVAFITLIFYFINTWLLNKFVFKRKFVLWRELTALGLLAGAFAVIGTGK